MYAWYVVVNDEQMIWPWTIICILRLLSMQIKIWINLIIIERFPNKKTPELYPNVLQYMRKLTKCGGVESSNYQHHNPCFPVQAWDGQIGWVVPIVETIIYIYIYICSYTIRMLNKINNHLCYLKYWPFRQSNVFWVSVCTKVKNCIKQLKSLHLQHLITCKQCNFYKISKNKNENINYFYL